MPLIVVPVLVLIIVVEQWPAIASITGPIFASGPIVVSIAVTIASTIGVTIAVTTGNSARFLLAMAVPS